MCPTQNDQNSLASTHKYFWGLLGFWGMSFVSVFNRLLSYWKTLSVEIFEVGWALASTTVPHPRGRTHHWQPSLELELQVVVVLDHHKLCYLRWSRLWDYGGWKVNTSTEVFTVVSTYGELTELGAGIPIQCFISWRWYMYHKLGTSHLCGESPKASWRPLIAW